jgi:hypothetical protein
MRASMRPAAPEEPPAPPTEASGSRFLVVRLTATFDDGATWRAAASGFWDQKHPGLCQIKEIGQDRYECVPDMAQGTLRDNEFADAACTTPVLAISGLQGKSFVQWGEPCSRKMGAVGPVPKFTYRKNPATDACEPIPGFAEGVIPLPAELPPGYFGKFVRAADVVAFPHEKNGTRLSIVTERMTGDDGSFLVLPPRIVDTARNAAGTVAYAIDGKPRILTTSGRILDSSSTFADAACTVGTRMFEKESLCHTDPLRPKDGYVSERAAGGCAFDRVFSRPEQPALTAAYRLSAGTCVPTPTYSSYDLYAASPPLLEVPPTSFVELTRRVVPTNAGANPGTVLEPRAVMYGSTDGFELRERSSTMYLRKYDVPCERGRVTGEQTPRCVPKVRMTDLSSGLPAFFADAACTRIASRLSPPSICAERESPLYRIGTDIVLVYKRPGSAWLSNVYVRDAGGRCVVQPVDGSDYVDTTDAEQVPKSDFPRGEWKIVTE